MKKYTFLAILAILSAHFAFAQFENYSSKIIETKGNYIPREECDFVVVKDKFYLIGGRGINAVNIFYAVVGVQISSLTGLVLSSPTTQFARPFKSVLLMLLYSFMFVLSLN